MVEDVGIRDLAESLVTALSRAGKIVTTAESCTGGWIAKAITDIPGSSSAFAYGFVSYSNGAKESLLGVQNSMLAEHGAVSSQVVKQMAEGALQLSGADVAVAVRLDQGIQVISTKLIVTRVNKCNAGGRENRKNGAADPRYSQPITC